MTNKTERIRVLNDALRTRRIGGRIMLTSGGAALPDQARQQALCAVRDFDAFTPDNDPLGEHDFASLAVADQRVMFKCPSENFPNH